MNYPNIVTAVKTMKDATTIDILGGSFPRMLNDSTPFFAFRQRIASHFSINENSDGMKFLPYTITKIDHLTYNLNHVMSSYDLDMDDINELIEDADKLFNAIEYFVNVQESFELLQKFNTTITVDDRASEYIDEIGRYIRGEVSYDEDVLDELITDIVESVKANFEKSINSLK